MQTSISFPRSFSLNAINRGTTHTVKSAPVSEDPLENPSFDARASVPDHGPLIPNPATYPAPSRLTPRDNMETTWGYGSSENLYNKLIQESVEARWPHQDFPLEPLTFKALVAAESAFKKDAVSPTGAVGLVQITTSTARAYGLKTSNPDERRIPEKAVPAGVTILADKLAVIKNPDTQEAYGRTVAAHYEQHGLPNPAQMETLALAGYNGGGSTVARAMAYAIEDGLDPKEYVNLVGADRPTKETPLYKAIKDNFGEKFANGKYKEMAEYPERIHNIRAREYQPLRGKKIMVDPGHGGGDAGAIGPAGSKESMINLNVGLKLRDKLEALGAEVRMTRDTDRKVSHPDASQSEELRARVAMANAWPAEVYVSVHSNSSANSAAHGTETYHSRNASAKSKEMAANVHEEMVKATGFRDRKVKQADFYVIKNTNMPAILVETGFVSNPVEEAHLVNPEMQDKMAQAIANGVQQTFGLNEDRGEGSFADTGRVAAPPVERVEELLLV